MEPLTLQEVARRYKITRQTAAALIHSGQLRAFRSGPAPKSPWRIPVEALADFEQGNRLLATRVGQEKLLNELAAESSAATE